MKINKKLFLGYISIFIITILIGYLLGKYSLQGVYEFTKKKELTKQMNKLKFSELNSENINNLERKLGVDIIAYNDTKEYNIKEKFDYLIVENDKRQYIILLDNLLDDLEKSVEFNVEKSLDLGGYKVFNGNYIVPETIKYGDKNYTDYEVEQKSNVHKIFQEKINLKNAVIKEISLKHSLKENYLELIIKAYKTNPNFNENYQMTYIDPYDEGEKDEVIVLNDNGNILIMGYSYKNISGVFAEFSDYFIYLLIIGLILIVILSMIFTKIITSPILKIKSITNKIIKLNFEEKINIKNKDEIGELADDINILSNTLGATLSKLEEDKKNIKEYMGNLSHEFKTPLTIISGYTDLLKEEKDDKYLNIISEETDKLTLLVNETIKAISLDTKVVDLNLEVFDLKELALKVIEKLKINIPENIELEINLEKSLVRADKNKIEQVMYNFMSNAIRHTKSKVKFYTEKSGDKIIFLVENNGNKIDSQMKDKVWMKFYKDDGGNESDSYRMGLGLYISKSILELHKSKYGVKDSEDGVIFYFTLDLKK
ncbi:MAG: HAMP domain-containing histidine kinase [Sebaldella sp.]|nr:HAMP domain-containing histidine kinase [Sebaldella sp.]